MQAVSKQIIKKKKTTKISGFLKYIYKKKNYTDTHTRTFIPPSGCVCTNFTIIICADFFFFFWTESVQILNDPKSSILGTNEGFFFSCIYIYEEFIRGRCIKKGLVEGGFFLLVNFVHT